jgi:hypothetical protein
MEISVSDATFFVEKTAENRLETVPYCDECSCFEILGFAYDREPKIKRCNDCENPANTLFHAEEIEPEGRPLCENCLTDNRYCD